MNLDPATVSPRALLVEVKYFDDLAADAKSVNEAEPSEEYLSALPAAIKRAFDSCRDLKGLRVSAEAKHLNDLGAWDRVIIQKFTFENSQSFNTLMTGEFREQWKTILAHPSLRAVPQYPRSRPPFLQGSHAIIILVAIFPVAFAVIVVVRMRMMKG